MPGPRLLTTRTRIAVGPGESSGEFNEALTMLIKLRKDTKNNVYEEKKVSLHL